MLIMKMSQDNINVIQARLNLNLLCDLHTLLDLSYLLPLLKVVNILIKFAQRKNIFICNFVTIIKIFQANIFMTYFDPFTSYQHEHFQVFCDIVDNNFTTIMQDWIIDLDSGTKTYFFILLVPPIKLTFFMQLLGSINLYVIIFFLHPSFK
jgi:hypothetical protein